MFFSRRYFFSIVKNIRNSQKVLLDLDQKYNKITQKKFAASQSQSENNENKNYPRIENSKKFHQKGKSNLHNKIKNLENPKRKKKYFKESSESIPFYDEKELQKRIYNSKNSEHLFSLYNGHKFTYSIKNIVTTFTVYAKLIKASKSNKIFLNDKRFISLLYTAEETITQMNNLEKILLYWTITKIEIKESILESLTKELGNSINSLNFKHLSIFTWCLAKNKIRNAELFGKISLRISEVLKPENNVEVCETVQETRKVEDAEEKDEEKSDLELEFNEEIEENEKTLQKLEIKSISSHSITLILWAFGKMRMKDNELFDLISSKIEVNFDKFSAKMLNIVLYAYKSVMIKSKIIYLISEKIITGELDISKESILTLKTYLLSISKLKPTKEISGFLIKITQIILEKNESQSSKLSPKFMSEILWNLATNKCYDKTVVKKLEKRLIENVHLMNEIDLTQCFYSFCVFMTLARRREFNNILDLLVERMKTFKRKFNKKSLKLIGEGKKLCDYQNKDLNF